MVHYELVKRLTSENRAWNKIATSTIVRCWVKSGLLKEHMEAQLTRSHGKANIESVMSAMASLALSIPDNIANPELAEVREAQRASDGALEHWANLEDDPLVQEATITDDELTADCDSDDEASVCII